MQKFFYFAQLFSRSYHPFALIFRGFYFHRPISSGGRAIEIVQLFLRNCLLVYCGLSLCKNLVIHVGKKEDNHACEFSIRWLRIAVHIERIEGKIKNDSWDFILQEVLGFSCNCWFLFFVQLFCLVTSVSCHQFLALSSLIHRD